MWQALHPYISVFMLWPWKHIGKPPYNKGDAFLQLSLLLQPASHRQSDQPMHIERARVYPLGDECICLQNPDGFIFVHLVVCRRQQRCWDVFLREEAYESQVLCSELVIPRDLLERNQPGRGHRVLNVLVLVATPILKLFAQQTNQILVI